MKKILTIISIVLVFGFAVLFIVNRDGVGTVDNTINTSKPSFAEVKYTKDDVAKHSTKDDCWTIIDNKVYDITSYIPRHPGGNNILSACGTDGTAFFNGQQAGQNGGIENHRGSKAESQLAQLFIGELSE